MNIRRLKALAKHLMYYAFILLIPLALFLSIIQFYILPVMINEVLETNKQHMLKISNQTDQLFEELDRIGLSITENRRLFPSTLSENAYKKYEGTIELNNYIYANSLLFDIYYYIRGDQTVYTSHQAIHLKTLFTEIVSFNNWIYEEIYKDLNNAKTPLIRSADDYFGPNFGKKSIIAYLYPLNRLETYATLVFLIDDSMLWQSLYNTKRDYLDNILIFDKSGHLISAFRHTDEINDVSFEKIYEEHDNDKIRALGLSFKPILVRSVQSVKSGRHYVSMIKTDGIMKQVYRIQDLTLISIFVVFIVGGILIAVATNKNYLPLKRLANKAITFWAGHEPTKNDIEMVEDIMDAIHDENLRLTDQSSKFSALLQENLIKELLFGRELDSELGEHAGFVIEPESSCLVLAYEHRLSADDPKAFYHHIDSLLKQRVQEVYSTKLIYKTNESQSAIVLFIKQKMGEPSSIITRRIKDAMDPLVLQTRVGAGNIYPDMFSLGRSYLEASVALQHLLIAKDGELLFFDDISPNTKNWSGEYSYYTQEIKRISFYLEKGDVGETLELIGSTITHLIQANCSIFILKCFMYDIYSTAYKTAVSMNIDIDSVFGHSFDFSTGREIDNLNHFYLALIEACKKLCLEIYQSLEAGDGIDHNLYQKLVLFIDENYCDYNLSLESMSQHFDVSAAYISKLFKDTSGITISAYIWDLRRAKAKSLLTETDTPIREIVQAVGYIDASSFSRKFKSSEQMTPSEYRMNHKK